MRKRRRARGQRSLVNLLGIKKTIKKQTGKVKNISSKIYRRTNKKVENLSTRNKSILRYAQNGTSEKELVKKMGLRPQTARVELKYLQRLGFVK